MNSAIVIQFTLISQTLCIYNLFDFTELTSPLPPRTLFHNFECLPFMNNN